MSEMQCPICGKTFDSKDCVIDENGNPICSECAEKENSDSDE